ncbi:MAG: aminotransferase class III-fold pyridoxal phosphate-dependent enzyme [Anaerolineaceae bacterium]|nr:aminotransferase class III-fold pyridoxal phosphate-dependent enzyme [Anaerolineaceae bacterium]
MAEKGWQNLDRDSVIDLCRKYTFTNYRAQGNWEPRGVITGGRGSYIVDADGTRYLDFSSQYMCANAGHNHPKITAAIRKQTERICYVDPRYATHARAELGRLLAEITPKSIEKSIICLSGSDANDHAHQIARQFTGRNKFITTYRSFHGSSTATGILTGESRRWSMEPGISGVVHVPAPYCYRCDFGLDPKTCNAHCAHHISQVIEYEGVGNVAAVMVEGVIGANGILLPHREDYLRIIRAICDKYGVLMIVDEVMSGFGRTGEWFAVDNWGVQPDIITMAKGLSASHLPLGAVGVSRKIAEYFNDHILWSGGTYTNHPVSCAAAIAAINVYRDEKFIENSKSQGVYLSEYLQGLKDRHPSIGDIRGIGLFQFIELIKNRDTKESFSKDNGVSDKGRVSGLDKEFLKRGINIKFHPLGMFIAPPLCIDREELNFGLNAVDEVLTEIVDRWVEK